jgi:hypothetical protein
MFTALLLGIGTAHAMDLSGSWQFQLGVPADKTTFAPDHGIRESKPPAAPREPTPAATPISDAWEGLLGFYKQFGLNRVRFHSWCPPEAGVWIDEFIFIPAD